MPVSILHISDLHRDSESPVSNPTLLSSLVSDTERALNEDPAIPKPNLIIVSGDLIQGVKKDHPDARSELKRQYEQTEGLLAALANTYLNGDRHRVVIVPGNHDVNFATMFSSLSAIDIRTIDPLKLWEYGAGVARKDGLYRWDWGTFSLFEIRDRNLYEERFAEFIEFYERFYCGQRTYSKASEEQYEIFDYPDSGIVIVGLNSCYGNDPWNRRGSIHPDSLANAALELNNTEYRNRIRVAVWHHSTKGGPNEDDYLDADILQQLISHKFTLGFHGHQHRPELIDARFSFGGDAKINVISASTLCSGERALPSGQPRAFNRVVVDTQEKLVQVHLRKMINSDFDNPIWGQHSLRGETFVGFNLHTYEDDFALWDMDQAEENIRLGKYAEAIESLEPLTPTHPEVYPLLLQAYIETKNHLGIINLINEPKSNTEIIAKLNALSEEGSLEALVAFLNLEIVRSHQDPAVAHLREKLIRRTEA